MTALRDDGAAGPYWNLLPVLRYTSESYWIWKIARVGREARSTRENVGVVADRAFALQRTVLTKVNIVYIACSIR